MLKLDYKIYQRNYPNFICDQRISYFKDKPCFPLLSFFLVKLRRCHPPSSFELCDVFLPKHFFLFDYLKKEVFPALKKLLFTLKMAFDVIVQSKAIYFERKYIFDPPSYSRGSYQGWILQIEPNVQIIMCLPYKSTHSMILIVISLLLLRMLHA